MTALTVPARPGGYLDGAHSERFAKANNMITLTAIVLALGLGWAIIKLWNAVAADTAPKAQVTETARQG